MPSARRGRKSRKSRKPRKSNRALRQKRSNSPALRRGLPRRSPRRLTRSRAFRGTGDDDPFESLTDLDSANYMKRHKRSLDSRVPPQNIVTATEDGTFRNDPANNNPFTIATEMASRKRKKVTRTPPSGHAHTNALLPMSTPIESLLAHEPPLNDAAVHHPRGMLGRHARLKDLQTDESMPTDL